MSECPNVKNGGLDYNGAGHFEQQQFGTAGAEWVTSVIFVNENENEKMMKTKTKLKRKK